VPRRRNGKQQACEPCRKAKIACDHGLPVCERCRRRKVPGKCVYVDAPLTRKVDVDVEVEVRAESRLLTPGSSVGVGVDQEGSVRSRLFIKSGEWAIC